MVIDQCQTVETVTKCALYDVDYGTCKVCFQVRKRYLLYTVMFNNTSVYICNALYCSGMWRLQYKFNNKRISQLCYICSVL